MFICRQVKPNIPTGRYDVLRINSPSPSPSPPPPVLSPAHRTGDRPPALSPNTVDTDEEVPPVLSPVTGRNDAPPVLSPVPVLDSVASGLMPLVSPVRPSVQNSPRSRGRRRQSTSPDRSNASPVRHHTPRDRSRTPRTKRREERLQCRNNCNPEAFFADVSSRNKHERYRCPLRSQV